MHHDLNQTAKPWSNQKRWSRTNWFSLCQIWKHFFERFGSMTGSYNRQPGKKENQYWLNFTKTNSGGKQAGEAHKNDSVVFRKGERERIWQGRRKMPRTITLTLSWEYKEPAADKQATKHTIFNTLKSDACQSRNQSMWSIETHNPRTWWQYDLSWEFCESVPIISVWN